MTLMYFFSNNYRKYPKYLDTRKIAVNILEFEQCGFTIKSKMCPKDANRIDQSVWKLRLIKVLCVGGWKIVKAPGIHNWKCETSLYCFLSCNMEKQNPWEPQPPTSIQGWEKLGTCIIYYTPYKPSTQISNMPKMGTSRHEKVCLSHLLRNFPVSHNVRTKKKRWSACTSMQSDQHLLLFAALLVYCKFTIICDNFIFANIHKFDRSQIQHSRKKNFVYRVHIRKYGPRQANLVLIAYASSEGSGEPAHPRSLARTFAARSYKQLVKRNLQTESQIPGPSEWLGMRS